MMIFKIYICGSIAAAIITNLGVKSQEVHLLSNSRHCDYTMINAEHEGGIING